MNDPDVYQQWKQQRSSIQPPHDFQSEVMARLAQRDTSLVEPSRPAFGGLLDHPAWAAVAVVAASIIGVVRVMVALLIGISVS